MWVDNIFNAGVLYFEKQVMEEILKKFLIGRTEEEIFTHIGLAIETTNQGITLPQINYIKDRLEPVQLKSGDNTRLLNKEEPNPRRLKKDQFSFLQVIGRSSESVNS